MDQASDPEHSNAPCFQPIPKAAQRHKDVYKIGVLAIRGVEAAFDTVPTTVLLRNSSLKRLGSALILPFLLK